MDQFWGCLAKLQDDVLTHWSGSVFWIRIRKLNEHGSAPDPDPEHCGEQAKKVEYWSETVRDTFFWPFIKLPPIIYISVFLLCFTILSPCPYLSIWISVADTDPYVFGPPGSASGSVSQRYGSWSGPFLWVLLSSSKNSKKPLTPTVLRLHYDFASLKNYVKVALKTYKQKNFLLPSWS